MATPAQCRQNEDLNGGKIKYSLQNGRLVTVTWANITAADTGEP